MRGIAFGGDRTTEWVDVPDPTPGPFDVVIEVRASGICGTDLGGYRGPRRPRADGSLLIAGHEPCGVVAEVGSSVAPWEAKVGDRVMVHHYWGCNHCEHCRSGWRQMCDQQAPVVYGQNAHGSHASHLQVPAGTVLPLPDELSFEAGAAIGCGTATAHAALERLGVRAGDRVAIFGQGPVGLAGTQFAAAMGAEVLAVDISSERLTLASAMGAAAVVDAGDADVVAALRELTGGRGVDAAMDASGATDARTQAMAALRPWGSLALVGVGGAFEPDMLGWLRAQVKVFTSWTFSTTGQTECARFAADRGIDVDAIFSERWSLGQADEAYRLADAQAAGKGVFTDFG